MIDFAAAVDLFRFPFMQRALLGGVITGLTGGLLGSFTVVRQLSFFSDALGHSAMLGITIGLLVGLSPSVVVLPFALLFGLGVTYLIEKTDLWTDALLNIVYSASLAISVIVLSVGGRSQSQLSTLLFGDILALRPADLWVSAGLFVICAVFLGLTLRTQMLITLNESMAVARGVDVLTQRMIFMMLLSLVVATSIKAIGALLVGAFVVIPACVAKLISQNFGRYVCLSAVLGAASAVVGIFGSALFELPSGPSIVVAQLCFLAIAGVSVSWKTVRSRLS